MATYAKDTQVTVDKSKAEIERILTRYGATAFMQGWDQERAVLAFVIQGRQIRMVVPMPAKEEFRYSPERRSKRTDAAMLAAWEQGCRQRWRALALVVKAKLEAVEAGISTLETEFLAHTVLPNGETVAQFMLPQIRVAYETGLMPALLPSGNSP